MENIKAIFIHVNKCGGTSVKKSLVASKDIIICTNNIPGSKTNIFDIQKLPIYKNVFSFTIIRHPFSRLISTYKMIKRDTPELNITIDNIIKIAIDPQISYNIPKSDNIKSGGMDVYIKRHTLPISHPHYGIVDENNNIKVSYVCKLENIGNDWIIIKKNLNIKFSLPKKNSTNNDKIQLNTDQIETLYKYYEKDFLIFNYNKYNY